MDHSKKYGTSMEEERGLNNVEQSERGGDRGGYLSQLLTQVNNAVTTNCTNVISRPDITVSYVVHPQSNMSNRLPAPP